MNYLEIGQSFVERCGYISRLGGLKSAFRQATQSMGFRYFACLSHIDPLRPPNSAVILHTYPRRWIKYVSENRIDRIDPVYCHANRTLQPFFWTDKEFLDGLTNKQKKVMEKAAEFGLHSGFTVPIHAPCPLPASCTVIPKRAQRNDKHGENPVRYVAVYLMAVYLHETAGRIINKQFVRDHPRPKLTPQEQRCLRYVALGKSDWAIAKILGLSPSTVHHHIEAAKRRLGTATRVQAVVEALYDQQLSFHDVIGALDE